MYVVRYYFMIVVYNIHSGYQCEQHNNPADFFLDVIIENEEANGLEGNYHVYYVNV